MIINDSRRQLFAASSSHRPFLLLLVLVISLYITLLKLNEANISSSSTETQEKKVIDFKKMQEEVLEEIRQELRQEIRKEIMEEKRDVSFIRAHVSTLECPYYRQYNDCVGPDLEILQARIRASIPNKVFENINNISIFFTGNSHVRQLMNVFLCVVGGNKQYPSNDVYITHRGSGLSIINLPQNIVVYHSTNNPFLYRTDWKEAHANKFNRSIDSFDVIVHGNYNKVSEMNPARYENISDLSPAPELNEFEPFSGLFIHSPGMLEFNRAMTYVAVEELIQSKLNYRMLNTEQIKNTLGYCTYNASKEVKECMTEPGNHQCVPGPIDAVVWHLLEILDHEIFLNRTNGNFSRPVN